MIAARLGTGYERQLKRQVPESKGFVDLVAYFHRRAALLTAAHGGYFLLGPQTLVSTANRRAAIEPVLASGRRIVWGIRRLVWPGEATVEVCVVGVASNDSMIPPVLDGERVATISAALESAFDLTSARRLKPRFRYSQGTDLYGLGFVKTRSEWEALVAVEPAIREYLRPYVNAEILCSSPTLIGDRVAVDFGEREKRELIGVSSLLAHLEEQVVQERSAQTRQIHEHRPWLHWDKRTETYLEARNLNQIVVCPNLSKHLPFLFADPQWLFAKTVKFFVTDRYDDYALLQSSFFYSWVVATSPLRGSTIAFSTRNSLDTYAVPAYTPAMSGTGQRLWEYRANAMSRRSVGITRLLNMVHDDAARGTDVEELREAQRDVDRSVSAAYGWTDFELDHDFRETALGLRYTISEAVKTEALDRLLELNHQRHAEEVAQGLHPAAKLRGAGRPQSSGNAERLFEA
jgi:hypothetical protein